MAQMSNDVFIDKLINSTKEGRISWEDGEDRGVVSPEGNYINEKSFYFDNSNKRVQIIYAREDVNSFDVHEDYYLDISFFDSSSRPIQLYQHDFSTKNILERLYRLAERSARRVDEVLSQIVASIEGDDFPF